MIDHTTPVAAAQFWAIEASAQALEAAADGFCEVAPPGDETASGLADSYLMAANEVRLRIPAYAAMKARNLAAIKAWDKASAPPDLERWDPMKYAPGGVDPDGAHPLALTLEHAYAEGRKDEREEWMPIRGQHITQAHHTPGPWFVTKRSDWNAICTVGRAWNISTQLPLADFGHCDLDAQLIAATPDLLNVAKLVVEWLDEEPDAHALCDTARAAISKATGA